MDWLSEYVGIPFAEHGSDHDGVDCWGIIRLIYLDKFGIALRDFADHYCSTKDSETIQDLIWQEAEKWEPVSGDAIQFGDVITFRMRGYESHVGMVCGPREMIHVDRGIDTVIERIDSMRWNRRLKGFYRHKDMKGIPWEQI